MANTFPVIHADGSVTYTALDPNGAPAVIPGVIRELRARWLKYDVPVRVLNVSGERATILVDGYECSDSCPADELEFDRG